MYERHPGVVELMRFLEPNPRLAAEQQTISQECRNLADSMLNTIPKDSPELTAGLRKLLEAKDCFVRASLDLTDEGL